WIVIQQRVDSSQSFNQLWNAYTSGFGIYDKNFWLGLEKMHQLTTSADYRLQFQFLANGVWYSDEYEHFRIGSALEKYVSGYIGFNCDILNSEDRNSVHNGIKFSTSDQVNTPSGYNYGYTKSSGNWFNYFYYQNLNGVYGIT
ncbi:hypothetical protein HELRODRAFT_144672, partial [Helobdella robusta]|uniref:Fibrinogen C-terminal domain-containing protein n=1 Tax=Helobdella robusta TaxID=6412 RepID=T1EJF8_HELRO